MDDNSADFYTPEEPVVIPIDGTLDLHTFSPREIGTLIPDYIHECIKQGIFEVRIVHGKGKGILRKSVHAILERSELVDWFGTAGHDRGHWGATLVRLKPQALK